MLIRTLSPSFVCSSLAWFPGPKLEEEEEEENKASSSPE